MEEKFKKPKLMKNLWLWLRSPPRSVFDDYWHIKTEDFYYEEMRTRMIGTLLSYVPKRKGNAMTRKEILEEAGKCVCTDRNQQYGEPEDNFAKIALLWRDYLGTDISSADVAVMMILFKIGREMTANNHKTDNFVDIAGYAACAGEIYANAPTEVEE